MSPEDFKRLAASGMTTDQIALVIELLDAKDKAFAAAEEARKSKGRERVAKWRETQRNVTDTSPKVTERLVRADKNISNSTDTNPSKKTSHTSKDVDAFRSALSGDVDGETLDEFIKVRRKKKGALTGFSAKLFREDAMACAMSVQDAARECVRSSWVTVKPEYFASRQRAGPPQAKPNRFTEIANSIGGMNGKAGFGTAVADDFDAGRSMADVEYRRVG